jgi:hypothetical protein
MNVRRERIQSHSIENLIWTTDLSWSQAENHFYFDLVIPYFRER